MKLLFIQFGNEMYPEQKNDISTQYWDSFYSCPRMRKLGYLRPEHAFELPKWIAEVSYLVPDAEKEVFWCTEGLGTVIRKIHQMNPDYVLMSLMDANKNLIYKLVSDEALYDTQFIIGGYNKDFLKKLSKSFSNVTTVDSVKDEAKIFKVPYVKGTDYSLFKDATVIPRLTMSTGCRNCCKFCTVPHGKVVCETEESIYQQVQSFKDLKFYLVYIDDKTFGQADNWKLLQFIYEMIKSYNPGFQGFVVQTTPSEVQSKAEVFAAAHVRVIELGLETANDNILKEYSKPATPGSVIEASYKAHSYGMEVIYNIIVGFPQETVDTYSKTYNFINNYMGKVALAINPAIYTDYSDEANGGELDFSDKFPNHWLSKFAWQGILGKAREKILYY